MSNINLMDEIDLIKHMNNAMNNSYEILVNNKTIEELLMFQDINNLVFAHDIETNNLSKEDIESIINYFSEMEDFEKCVELSKLIR